MYGKLSFYSKLLSILLYEQPRLVPWLKVGIKRFAADGLEGLNINEISAEIKISKTSFYHFFGSKQEYINELFEHWLQEGTINIIKDAFLNDNAKSTNNTLFRKVIFDNYQRDISIPAY